jgi:hypothetical protein
MIFVKIIYPFVPTVVCRVFLNKKYAISAIIYIISVNITNTM